MADPEQYRTKEEVAQWRARDPITSFGDLLIREGVIDERQRAEIDRDALERVDAAVAFAEDSPLPRSESLYDDVYVLEEGVAGWYSVKRTGEARPAEALASEEAMLHAEGADEIPRQISSALELSEDAS
jgi:hypothetical protein